MGKTTVFYGPEQTERLYKVDHVAMTMSTEMKIANTVTMAVLLIWFFKTFP